MKKIHQYLLGFGLIVAANAATAQKIYLTNNINNAQVKIYVTNSLDSADLKVKVVAAEADINSDGMWLFAQTPTEANFRIFYVSKADEADLSVYFVPNIEQAGWINKEKVVYFKIKK